MKYIITDEQIDRILKPFFEGTFKDAKLIEYDYEHAHDYEDEIEDYTEGWVGFSLIKDGKREVLLGRPSETQNKNEWFSNGEYFNGWWDMFNLELKDFNESMRRFVNEKYNMNIDKIF